MALCRRAWWPGRVLLAGLAVWVATLPGCGSAPAAGDGPAKKVDGAAGHSPGPVVDLLGAAVDPLSGRTDKGLVLVFTRIACPIANRYAPEIRRLSDKFGAKGVRFLLVFPEASDSAAAIATHLTEFDLPIDAVRDPGHTLADRVGATVTPEALVFLPGEMTAVYRGRIDDLYQSFGQRRAAPTTHDLEDVLDKVVSGQRPETTVTSAVGCYIGEAK